MTILATAKSRVSNGSIKEAFKNEDGAIDLASIMVGIIVIGIIGGVIAATVFAVIPWAQDNAAKGQLDTVATAESAYLGFTSETGTAVYGSEADLLAPSTTTAPGSQGKALFTDSGATRAAGQVAIVVTTTAGVSNYTAYSKSSSGKYFSSTNGAKGAVAADQAAAKTAFDANN